MADIEIRCQAVPALPWQERSDGCTDVVWRYRDNPVIDRNPIPAADRIFNSAVVPYGDGFIGVFRADYKAGTPRLHVGRSADGFAWAIEEDPIELDAGRVPGLGRMEYAYDPRVCIVDGRYYVVWCNGYHGPTIGLARTDDFVHFEQLENAFLPCNRNGVLFPRKINGRFAMLSRPSDNGHTPFGDIFYSESPDLCFWGRHRFVLGAGNGWWRGLKVGAGPMPIETSAGWLTLYHGVNRTCSGYVYRMGAALLDLDEPWKVVANAAPFLLSPEEPYECVGFVPNVVFPCAALCDGASGRLAIYYGAADTCVAVAFSTVQDLVAFVLA